MFTLRRRTPLPCFQGVFLPLSPLLVFHFSRLWVPWFVILQLSLTRLRLFPICLLLLPTCLQLVSNVFPTRLWFLVSRDLFPNRFAPLKRTVAALRRMIFCCLPPVSVLFAIMWVPMTLLSLATVLSVSVAPSALQTYLQVVYRSPPACIPLVSQHVVGALACTSLLSFSLSIFSMLSCACYSLLDLVGNANL